MSKQKEEYYQVDGVAIVYLRAKRGEVQKWLNDVALKHEGDECLLFPFRRNDGGYGEVRRGKKVTRAHIAVIEATGRPKPGIGFECRHLCGNGHLGCVAPAHLAWGTHAENMADAVAHGTTRNAPRYGEDHHDFRANDEVVANILRDISLGMTQRRAAEKYGFAQSHISRIKCGWRRAQV